MILFFHPILCCARYSINFNETFQMKRMSLTLGEGTLASSARLWQIWMHRNWNGLTRWSSTVRKILSLIHSTCDFANSTTLYVTLLSNANEYAIRPDSAVRHIWSYNNTHYLPIISVLTILCNVDKCRVLQQQAPTSSCANSNTRPAVSTAMSTLPSLRSVWTMRVISCSSRFRRLFCM